MTKRIVTEAEFERMVDAAVQGRLSKDHSYLFAENAEEQTDAEERIEREETARIAARFEVS